MILVGPLFSCLKNKNWRYYQACHLFTDRVDRLEELHKFAKRIRLKRSWFQDSVLPHYDLTASKQRAAIKAGATLVSRNMEGQYIREWRARNWNTE